LEKKVVSVDGFHGPEEAKDIVRKGVVAYQKYIQEQEKKHPNTWTPGFAKFQQHYRK
jgi:uncharacterized short protein YbdD (DUF466 family)